MPTTRKPFANVGAVGKSYASVAERDHQASAFQAPPRATRPEAASLGASLENGIDQRRAAIKNCAVPVETPFIDVAVHVEEAECIRTSQADGSRIRRSLLADDGMLGECSRIVAERPE